MQRIFDDRDQAAFAALSGDSNPLHVDAEAARRLTFDRPVVHGLHGVLWALETWLAARPGAAPLRLLRLAAEFRAPIVVGEPVACRIEPPAADGGTRLRLEDAAGGLRAEVRLAAAPAAGGDAPGLPAAPPPLACLALDEAAIDGRAGAVPLGLDRRALARLAPRVAERLPPLQVAALLATTRLVGMECPGLHSVYLGLALDFDPAAADGAALSYAVRRYDPRFRFLDMAVQGAGARGEVRALLRASPVAQPGMAEIAALVPAARFAGRRALVVGGSRGLGETCAKLLAAGGAQVVLTYARGAADAARVVDEIGAAGGSARALALDVAAVPADWADGLGSRPGDRPDDRPGDWRPSDLFYFATPRIRPTRDRRFSLPAYRDFHAVYVDGFLEVFDRLRHGLEQVFYPSSIYVEERPKRFSEYVAAKAAGEAVCAALAALHPGVRFSVPRLPRLASDQTSQDDPAAAPALLAALHDAGPAAPGQPPPA